MRTRLALIASLASGSACVPWASERPELVAEVRRPEALPDTSPRTSGHPDAPATRVGLPPRPVENLAPLWRLDDDPARTDDDWTLADANARYALFDRRLTDRVEVMTVDLRDGRRVATATSWRASINILLHGAYRPALTNDDLVLAFRDPTTLVAIDAASGRERWTSPIRFDWVPLVIPGCAADVVLLRHVGLGLVALDARTGRERWQWRQDTHLNNIVVDAQRAYACRYDDGVHALDLRDGSEAWRMPLSGVSYGGCQLAVAGRQLLLSVADGDRLIDAATGQGGPARVHPISPRFPATAVLSAGVMVRESGPTAIEGWALAEERVAWRRAGAVEWSAAGSDAAFVCSPGGVLRAIDAASGADRWAWGLAQCRESWPYLRPWFVVAQSPTVGEVLLLRTARGTVALGRAPAPSTSETATIVGRATVNGRPRAGLVVRVGDAVTRTNAGGTFRATVTLRGGVAVRVTDRDAARASGRPCGWEGRAFVAFTGAGTYRVRVDAGSHGYVIDRACDSD